MTNITLPPLPVATEWFEGQGYCYDDADMQDYARDAVLADRETRGEPAAWVPATALDFLSASSGGRATVVLTRAEASSHIPLYAAPQPVEQRRPLSDKEIEAIASSMAAHDAFTFTRAIEAAHGIKEAT